MSRAPSARLLAVVSLTSALALAACKGGSSSTGNAPASSTHGDSVASPAPPSDEILIGEYGSLTGSEATFGQSTHNGLLLAVDQINAQGGAKVLSGGKPTLRKVRVVNYDDQGKTSEASTAVTRLITSDHVLAVIGEVASSLSIAGGQVCQKHKVPMITPSSTNEKVTEVGDYVFRVCFVDSFQGYVMAKFATDAKPTGLGIKKVAVLVDQRQAYAQGLARDFDASLKKLGGAVVAKESYQGGDQDFSAQLGNIKAAQPEAIYVPGYYTDVANIARQVRGMGITVPLLGGDGWESVQDIGGDAIQGAFYSNHYASDEDRAEVKQFVEAYTKKFGKTPDSMSALAYDALMLITAAIEKDPLAATDRQHLRDAIAQTKDLQGVTGKITIDGQRNARKPAVVLKIVGKSSTTAATILPPS